MNLSLFQAVQNLATATQAMSDNDLGQPWAWGPHDEGVRFAHLGTYQELRDLAVRLRQKRAEAGLPFTNAHHLLAQNHAAYRDVQAILLGVSDEDYDKEPAAGEWPMRVVLGHVVGAQRNFFTLVHYGLDRQRLVDDIRPVALPEDETEKVVGPYSQFAEMMEHQSLSQMLAFYETLHQRALAEFANASDAELEGLSLWWENIEFSLHHRLHRFDAHSRQHMIQAEKTLEMIGRPVNEAKRLLRLLYNALAEAESLTIGAPELGQAEMESLAETISGRAVAVAEVVQQAKALLEAIKKGDKAQVEAMLNANKRLANIITEDQLSAVMLAAYYGQREIANLLMNEMSDPGIFEAVVTGRSDIVQGWVNEWPPAANLYNKDGFSPLPLACFFNQPDIALFLIEHGADVNQVAKNKRLIRPVHAAAASGNLDILRALLEYEADPNARQEGNFTPLHEAANNGNQAMAELLLSYQANKTAMTANGKTPYDLALEKGHQALAEFLKDRAV